jgi:hypothetical protein
VDAVFATCNTAMLESGALRAEIDRDHTQFLSQIGVKVRTGLFKRWQLYHVMSCQAIYYLSLVACTTLVVTECRTGWQIHGGCHC